MPSICAQAQAASRSGITRDYLCDRENQEIRDVSERSEASVRQSVNCRVREAVVST